MKLQTLVERYIANRRAMGEEQRSPGYLLRAFGDFVGEAVDADSVTCDQIEAFLGGRKPLARSWHSKYYVLHVFYKYALRRGYVTRSPLPVVVPKRPSAFVPYIYSHQELQTLVQMAKAPRPRWSRLESDTFCLALVTLYATGLRVRELINLNRADVNFTDSVITVHRGKFGKTRLVPIGMPLHQALQSYAQRHAVMSPDSPFFITRTGNRIKIGALQQNFRKLCRRTGIMRADGGRFQPRLHDLRHTFAVHRLTAWYRQGANVQKLLPQLSTYLGHVYIQATQVYLTMTPELLQEAGRRFERYVTKEYIHV